MRLRRILFFGLSVITVPLGACTSSPGIDSEAPDMKAFWAAHAAHRQRGDLGAAISILAEDCVLFEPFQPPVSGRESIAHKMQGALAMTEIHEVSLEPQEVYHHGGRLVDFGTFSETFSLSGEEDRHTVEGNYAAVLEQDADGDWKVKRLMALPSSPLPREVKETAPGASTE